MNLHPKATHRSRIIGAAVSAFALVLTFSFVSAVGAAPSDHKVTLCHATDSYSNPYVVITTDYHSVVNGGHGNHEGPLFSPDLPKHTKWGDIIPSFDFGPGASYGGMNLADGGQAMLDDNCAGVPSTTTTTIPPN